MSPRIDMVRAEFERKDIQAFLVTNPQKVRYLTGFVGHENVACLITRENSYFISDSRFTEQAEKEVKNCQIVIGGLIATTIFDQRLLAGVKRVGLESDLSLGDYLRFCQFHPEIVFVSVDNLVDQLASVKDEEEIQKIKTAMELTEHVFAKHILPKIRIGITENDLAAEISYWGKKYGAEEDAFIEVASGVNSSLVHAGASSNQLKAGDILQFDFGYVVDGYPSDFSRVVFLGEPNERQRAVYGTVLKAQELAIAAAEAGVPCRSLHQIAAEYIKSQGEDLPHGVGHGLGIMIHSAPSVNGSTREVLRNGHVITIEPGIYIPGWGGIRIEDVILITENGRRNLTTFTKEITVVS